MAAPTQNHLSRLYYELGKIGARSVGAKRPWRHPPENREALFALACDWSRFDPRLLQVLVEYGLRCWKTLSPQRLRESMHQMETPQTVGVVAAFIQSTQSSDSERILFWDYVTADLEGVPPQFYFRDLYPPGSRSAERAAKESLDEFSRWGFLGRERVIVNTQTRQGAGRWNSGARLNILRRLFQEHKSLRISDYLEELSHSISRQQALLDLKKVGARPEGKGRSAKWKAGGQK